MAQTISREQKLKTIQAQIKQNEAYLKMDNNPYAQSRVDALSKNPCLSGKYYLNAVFKDTLTIESEEAAKNYATTNRIEYAYTDYFNNAYIVYPKLFQKDDIQHIQGFTQINSEIQRLISTRIRIKQ